MNAYNGVDNQRYNMVEWAVRCFGASREVEARAQAWRQLRVLQTRHMNVKPVVQPNAIIIDIEVPEGF